MAAASFLFFWSLLINLSNNFVVDSCSKKCSITKLEGIVFTSAHQLKIKTRQSVSPSGVSQGYLIQMKTNLKIPNSYGLKHLIKLLRYSVIKDVVS